MIHLSKFITVFIILSLLLSCKGGTKTKGNSSDTDATKNKVVAVDTSLFLTNGVTISTIPCKLSDGTKTECYQIVTKAIPSDHQMGPWCPENISDNADAGGIWLNEGKVYDVDGAFVKNLASFYNDTKWQMYDDNGDIFVTDTKEDCENAANPNVGVEYENFCVECLPSYITDVSQTFVIPKKPVLLKTPVLFSTGGRGPRGGGPPPDDHKPNGDKRPEGDDHKPPKGNAPSTRGVALNGVEFSAPAPADAILSAYTLAPFDDAGGHINVHQGYHYHAATGVSAKVAQTDGHAALIGYALDGFGMYELKDADGDSPKNLDELRGHSDETRGYHYHVDQAGKNNFINGLKGAFAN